MRSGGWGTLLVGIQPTKGNGHSEAKRRWVMRDEVRGQTTNQEQDGLLKIRISRFHNQPRWE